MRLAIPGSSYHLAAFAALFFGSLVSAVGACGARSSIQGEDRRGIAPTATCGDHVVQVGEACDDGNDEDRDACVLCRFARCGDGVAHVGVEGCDDPAGQTGVCRGDCSLITCGDGAVDQGEDCDDGNDDDTDACPSLCVHASCGDGHVRAGVEACDLGPQNADKPALVLTQGSLRQAVAPVDRLGTASAFYDYGSASSHTGLEAVRASRLYLYRDLGSGDLSLIVHHGVDVEATGVDQPNAEVFMQFVHLPPSVFVALADDKPEELFADSDTSITGRWDFGSNTDGGVLGGLPFPGSWSVDVVPGFNKGIDAWSYVDGDLAMSALSTVAIANLTAFDAPAACRLDCTVPRCGDAIVDGGEVCDDGNTAPGDGCAADCRLLD